ncbi:MAG: hypothetical protein IH586_14395 [Anaerolineaceae bacterium]|nr:hypothetical protein [Anaerolineaceae bacterium]
MSHQPYETWILDQQNLSTDDRRSLQTHLDDCPQCLRLQYRWQMVRQELTYPRMVAPAPGFTQRWQTGLVERKAREQRKQAWKIAGLLLAAALIVLLVMATYTLATTSFTDWLVAVVGIVSSTTGLLNLGIHFVQNWLSSTPLAMNIVLWIYLTVCISLLTFVWVLVLWRTNIVGVFNR